MGLKRFLLSYPKSIFRTFWLVAFIGLTSIIVHNLFGLVPWLAWLGVPFFFIAVAASLPLIILLTLLPNTLGLVTGIVLTVFYLLFVSCAIVAMRKLKSEHASFQQELRECRTEQMESSVNKVLKESPIDEVAEQIPSPIVKRKKHTSKPTKAKKKKRTKSSR